MSGTLAVVDAPGQARGVRGAGADPAAGRWVCLDVTAALELDAAGIPYRTDEEYVPAGSLRELEGIAHEAAVAWPAALGEAWRARGIPVAEAVFKDLAYFLLGLLRAHRTVQAVLAAERPARVVVHAPRRLGPATQIRLAAGESHVASLLGALRGPGGAFDLAVAGEDGEEEDSDVPEIPLHRRLAPSSLGNGRGRAVLFSGSGSLLGPVVRALAARHGFGAVEAAVRPGVRAVWRAARAGHGFLALDPATPDPGEAPTDEALRAACDAMRVPLEGIDPLPFLEPRARFLLGTRLPALRRQADRLHAELARISPRAVLLDEDVTESKRLLAALAESRGIPAFVVQHGVPLKPLGFVPPRAGRMAVWGDRFRDLFGRWGVPRERMRVTGCPRYDAYAAAPHDPAREREVCRALGLPPGGRLVVFAPAQFPVNNLERFDSTLSNPWEFRRFVEASARAARRFPSLSVVLKLHAGGYRPGYFERLAPALAGIPNLRVAAAYDTRRLLESCSLLVSSYSSIVLEGALLGRNVVVANLSPYPADDPYRDAGGVRSAGSWEEIESELAALVRGEASDPDPAEGAGLRSALLAGADRGAAARVADWIAGVAG